jgi:esterase/lipase
MPSSSAGTVPEHPFYAGPDHGPFVIGEGDAAILLVHGFPGTPKEFRPLAARLAAAGWVAHGVLLPGFGREIATLPQRRGQDWLRAAAREWRALQRRYALTALLGYSFGATIATALAARWPPACLILIAPWWRFGVPGEFFLPLLRHLIPSFAPFRRADFANPRLRAFFADIAPDLDLDDPAVQQGVREHLTIATPVLDEMRRLGRQSLRDLTRVHVPTLILQSRDDQTVPIAATRRLLQRAAGPLHYRELPGDHHLVRLETPGGEHLVEAILAELAAARARQLAGVQG